MQWEGQPVISFMTHNCNVCSYLIVKHTLTVITLTARVTNDRFWFM